MSTFNTPRKSAMLAQVCLVAVLCLMLASRGNAQSCTDTFGTFSVTHGMPNGGGAVPVQDCSGSQVPYISFTFSGVVPDNIYSRNCNGHQAPDKLDIWISRTGTDDPDTCASCPPAINLWSWNGSQWVNNSTYIDASGNSTNTLTMTLISLQASCKTSTCLWIFTGKRDPSSTCAQLSNDCFNSGSVRWSRACQ